MSEIWLQSNRRALALGLILPGLLIVAGALLVMASDLIYLRFGGCLLAATGVLGSISIGFQMRQPRLAVQDRHLLVYARSGPPDRVPIEVVEGFLLGQGPSLLPGKRYARTETATFTIRLAESADQWAQREMHPSLGKWCGSYITIRGTWCEPLDLELVQRLNLRLAEVQGRIAQGRP